MKPNNPYHPGTIIWSIFEGDWDGLTASQIAEVLDCKHKTVLSEISRIRQDTGYDVLRVRGEPGRRSYV